MIRKKDWLFVLTFTVFCAALLGAMRVAHWMMLFRGNSYDQSLLTFLNPDNVFSRVFLAAYLLTALGLGFCMALMNPSFRRRK